MERCYMRHETDLGFWVPSTAERSHLVGQARDTEDLFLPESSRRKWVYIKRSVVSCCIYGTLHFTRKIYHYSCKFDFKMESRSFFQQARCRCTSALHNRSVALDTISVHAYASLSACTQTLIHILLYRRCCSKFFRNLCLMLLQ